MNKKVLIAVIVVIVVIALVVGGIFLFTGKKGGNSSNLDLATISTKVTETGFAEMSMQEVDMDTLSGYYQVDTANVAEVYGKMPMMNIKSSMYVLIKATEGKVEEVKQDIEKFGERYEEQWATYLPDQYDLVVNRKIGTIGDYVYLVIAENADEIVKLIK